jgi:hypothetical protein
MIIARLTNGAFIVGIDDVNVRHMDAGRPMVIDLAKHGGHDRVYLLHGKTLEDVRKLLIDTFGELPIAQPLPGEQPK